MDFSKAISPIDGRYGKRLEHLSDYFSEYALMHSRCKVEILYALALSDAGILYQLDENEKANAYDLINNFTIEDYNRIKEIEDRTRHDVKSCEIFLREKLNLKNNSIIHFGLTSEDVNNLAYTFLFKDYVVIEQLPQTKRLIIVLYELAEKTKSIPFPSRTHGQKASPSTVGKEISVFINRLLKQYIRLKKFRFSGKLNGAVGNYSAVETAFRNVEWRKFASDFINSLDIDVNIATTQIEDHDRWAEWFNITNLLNNIVIDLDTDFWLYISRDLFFEQPKEGEVGSSTMPHKVNPINFENSEGNMMVSNSLLTMFSNKLTRSRMQRDLSDSTVTRNIGVGLSHSYLAIEETIKGLNKIAINKNKCIEELDNSPELLAEPIQTVLKTAGINDPYTLLKNFTRGKKVSKKDLDNFIDNIDGVDKNVKDSLLNLDVRNYTGYAERICNEVLDNTKKELEL